MNNKNIIVCVREIMKIKFSTISGAATISEALAKMKLANTSVLVVNKRHNNDEHGLITCADIARKVMAKDRSPKRVNVYEIMEAPVISVPPEMDIRYCARLFANYNLVRAPVLENSNIIGIVSPNSLVLDGLYKVCS